MHYRNVTSLVIAPDHPQPWDWHCKLVALVQRVPNDDTGSTDSQALIDALDTVGIRGTADGFEFHGFDYRVQTWLTFTYVEVCEGARRSTAQTMGI